MNPHSATPDGAPTCRTLPREQLAGPVLAIDTSGALSIAIVPPSGDVLTASDPAPRQHAERLAPLVAGCLDRAGLRVADLHAIAVGTGPAAFTGLRVGLMTAHALAAPSGLPVWGVPSLDATAAAWAAHRETDAGDRVIVVRDAKRRELFYAGYAVTNGVLARVMELSVGSPVAIGVPQGEWSVTGDTGIGAQYGLDLSEFAAVDPDPGVDAVALALLAAQRAFAGEDTEAEPRYLRRPDVQQPTATKRASQ